MRVNWTITLSHTHTLTFSQRDEIFLSDASKRRDVHEMSYEENAHPSTSKPHFRFTLKTQVKDRIAGITHKRSTALLTITDGVICTCVGDEKRKQQTNGQLGKPRIGRLANEKRIPDGLKWGRKQYGWQRVATSNIEEPQAQQKPSTLDAHLRNFKSIYSLIRVSY